MSTIKTKKVQLGTDANSANNFTIYQPATPDGTLRIGVGNAENPTEVGQFNANGYKPAIFPAFKVYMTTNQSISNNTLTKISFDNIRFDTTNNYDTVNYRWTPTVAGYYSVYLTVHPAMASVNGHGYPLIRKNGSTYSLEYTQADTGNSSNGNCRVSALVYLNGTTDYIEAWFGHNFGTTKDIYYPEGYTFFQGHLVQQA